MRYRNSIQPPRALGYQDKADKLVWRRKTVRTKLGLSELARPAYIAYELVQGLSPVFGSGMRPWCLESCHLHSMFHIRYVCEKYLVLAIGSLLHHHTLCFPQRHTIRPQSCIAHPYTRLSSPLIQVLLFIKQTIAEPQAMAQSVGSGEAAADVQQDASSVQACNGSMSE